MVNIALKYQLMRGIYAALFNFCKENDLQNIVKEAAPLTVNHTYKMPKSAFLPLAYKLVL